MHKDKTVVSNFVRLEDRCALHKIYSYIHHSSLPQSSYLRYVNACLRFCVRKSDVLWLPHQQRGADFVLCLCGSKVNFSAKKDSKTVISYSTECSVASYKRK